MRSARDHSAGDSKPFLSGDSKSEVKNDEFAIARKTQEALPVYFPPGIMLLFWEYLGKDVILCWPGNPEIKPFTSEQLKQFTLFGKTSDQLIDPEATELGNLILRGEEKEVVEVLRRVREKPHLLRCPASSRDPLDRNVIGTPLQIAAMAGDVGLIKGDRGLVEQLIEAGNLTHDEVVNQLEVVTSFEAKLTTESRNKQTQHLVEKFADDIIREIDIRGINRYLDMSKDNLKIFHQNCDPHFQRFKKALIELRKEVIKIGLISDPTKLKNAVEWFENNTFRFGGKKSIGATVFFIYCFGTLQGESSSRDAQVIHADLNNLVKEMKIPSRHLQNPDGTSNFFNSHSRLGVTFYYGYRYKIKLIWARPHISGDQNYRESPCWITYIEQKNLQYWKFLPVMVNNNNCCLTM